VSLFKKAEVTSAYLKMGVMGFAGAGKTYTATQVAIGLVEYMRERKIAYADKPVFFLDTETGSDWVLPVFREAGIDIFTAKTRAFRDLMTAVAEAEADGSLLIVDSISHFWQELCDAYVKTKNRSRLQFEDWAYLKKEWRKFTDRFVNSNLHILLCGRAGYEYDYFENDAGKKELEKTGIKMKAEGEMGYEPSLLVLMERETDMATLKVRRVARILKDRSTRIDGRDFTNPTFKSFLPHIEYLNLGGQQLGVDTTRTSEGDIPADAPRDRQAVRRKVVLGDVQDLLVLHFPGQTAAEKQKKVALLRKHFAAGWTEMEEVMPLADLQKGLASLKAELEPEKPAEPEKPVDEIPHQEPAPPASAEAEIDDMELVVREMIAEVSKEPDAKKRKAIWDANERARQSMTDAQVARLKAALEEMAAGKPRGRQAA
jgi:hypothetical protein